MRALLVLVALAIVVLIALTYTGVISLRQTQEAQAPKFDLKVKQVEVGTTTTNVQVPTVGTRTKQIETPTIRVVNGSDSNSQ
jgi:cytochrome oxidase Cu insertion factor (SCO1/SenC/PrrC family)